MENTIRLSGDLPSQGSRDSILRSRKSTSSSLLSFLSSTTIQALAIAAISAMLFLFKLGKGALLDWDEAIHAEVSKEIVSSHHWLTLYWQHEPYFRKPPLSFWIRAAFFQWFGVTEFWARFASALAGIAIVLLTYAIARRLSGATAGLFAAFVLLTTNHFDRVVREGTTDALLCLCIFLAMYAYQRLREANPFWFYALCATIGAGAMIKGPAILVVPLAIGADWLFKRERRFVFHWREYCLGGLLFLVIVAPWHIWMIFKFGRAFWDDYFGYQIVARATGVIEDSGGGPFYYVRIIVEGAFPWSFVAVFAALNWLWCKEWKYSPIWALASITLIGYSLIPTKHPWYVFPTYPALAIGAGGFLAEIGKNRRIVKYASIAVLTLGIIIAFRRLAIRQGDPFTNKVAELAKTSKGSPGSGPLLIITRPDSEPALDTPTAVFYSDRKVIYLEVPTGAEKIADALKSRNSADAIIQNDALGFVSQMYEIHSVAQNDPLSYSIISRKY